MNTPSQPINEVLEILQNGTYLQSEEKDQSLEITCDKPQETVNIILDSPTQITLRARVAERILPHKTRDALKAKYFYHVSVFMLVIGLYFGEVFEHEIVAKVLESELLPKVTIILIAGIIFYIWGRRNLTLPKWFARLVR